MYAPIVPFWLGYMLRSGAVWFFTPSNPKITFGGMEGEPKQEMYDLLPKHLYPETIFIEPGSSENELLTRIAASEIEYPLIVKPDNGGQGILFRKIDTVAELLNYHRVMPFRYMVQKMVTYPMEVSVFHIRYPDAEKGAVTGFLHKVPLHVTGDGRRTLGELIAAHPKAFKRTPELFPKYIRIWNDIVPEGARFQLSYAANHNRGAQFFDLKAHIDDKLVAVFDKISTEVDDFFYGRYDIMCNSIEELKQGKNFYILEYNGCGAEPNHFYDTGYTLTGAYREILKHWKALYEISKYNRINKKIQPWTYREGKEHMRRVNKMFATMREIESRIP